MPKQKGPGHANHLMHFSSPGPVMQESIKYKILKKIADNPKVTQRQLARELDVSLGKANYCLRALIDKGWIKVENFRQSSNKIGYIYKLTPAGLDEKGRVAVRFLKMKKREYEEIKAEIERLRSEVGE
ncbi:MAG: MarR family EPS-associated transcriptional regulator [Dissulfuribacterales bacterium]